MSVRIKAEALRRLAGAAFVAAGCSPAESARIAHYLVEANLSGHDSHGVLRLPRYVQWLREGTLVPDQSVAVITETPVMAVLDGRHGFGQTIGPQAVELGLDKAGANGVSVIALRNSGHLGRIADWAEMAARAGLASIHFVNVAGSLLVAPFGAVERRMSTNPFAIGLPLGERPPLLLDFATSLVAEGKVMVAAEGGEALPPASLIDADGTLSADPALLYGAGEVHDPLSGRRGRGALRPMGEHKGSGLALVCELLAGALTGSGCAGPGTRPIANGMLSIYLSLAAFDGEAHFAREAARFIEFFTGARPAAPSGEVLTPGEPERRCRAERLAAGIGFSERAWAAILKGAREAGLGQAEIDAALKAGP